MTVNVAAPNHVLLEAINVIQVAVINDLGLDYATSYSSNPLLAGTAEGCDGRAANRLRHCEVGGEGDRTSSVKVSIICTEIGDLAPQSPNSGGE